MLYALGAVLAIGELATVQSPFTSHRIGVGTATLDFYLPRADDVLGEDAFPRSGWDVICGGSIEVNQSHPEYKRSASLWYTKQQHKSADYRWYEVGYEGNPLTQQGFQFEPTAVTPELADRAHSQAMDIVQTSYGPVPIDDEDLDAFCHRWAHILAEACHGADLLRDLYQGLTTRQLRKALGEFLTPHWLAQATIDAAKRNGADVTRERVLDCTCGTGTFLRPLLSARLQQLRMKHEGAPPIEKVQEILDSVVGIDINPVAVVATRMNYLMALGELATTGGLYLPVWLADSVLLPSPPAVQTEFADRPELAGRRFVELLTSLDEPFVVPEEFLSQGALARLAALLRQAIRAQYSTDEFQILLESDLGPNADRPVTVDADEWDNAVAVLRALYEQLSDLHAAGRNEVWAEVIENRFAPLFLGRFDIVMCRVASNAPEDGPASDGWRGSQTQTCIRSMPKARASDCASANLQFARRQPL